VRRVNAKSRTLDRPFMPVLALALPFVPFQRTVTLYSYKKMSATLKATSEKSAGPHVYMLPDGRLSEKMPLSAVVTDAVKRWYIETEREASRGDVKAMALLGQMLMEGYGCQQDVDLGKKWADKARRRGYRMQRVYCEI
jgi:TPR repeat protein